MTEAARIHQEIMNLPCNSDPWGYKLGHRDARHAAAELAQQAVAKLEAQLACHTGTASWLLLEQLTAIRAALGMPDATVPEMVERIGELRRDSLGEVCADS